MAGTVANFSARRRPLCYGRRVRSCQPLATTPCGATALPGSFYPVAQSAQLGQRPLLRTIGGQAIALFRDAQGRAQALDACCPHRGANLADGRIVAGTLACPYHGWRFSGAGHCVLVPSHPEQAIPARSAVRAFAVVEQQGVIWVRLSAEAGEPPPPRFAIADDPRYRRFVIEDRYPGPADWWMENFLDISHVPFVHRGTFSGQQPRVRADAVERHGDERSFSARVRVHYQYGTWARLIHGALRDYGEDVRFHVIIPATIYLENDMGSGRRQALAFYATPEDAHTTRVILTVYRNYLTWLPGADAIGRRFTRRVLAEDQRIVERSIAPLPTRERAAMAADGPVQELARLMRRARAQAAAAAPDQSSSPALESLSPPAAPPPSGAATPSA